MPRLSTSIVDSRCVLHVSEEVVYVPSDVTLIITSASNCIEKSTQVSFQLAGMWCFSRVLLTMLCFGLETSLSHCRERLTYTKLNV